MAKSDTTARRRSSPAVSRDTRPDAPPINPDLSDAEAAYLADQIDHAPAGGDSLLGVLVFIFVLLLVTDILGLTKVFPFTRSVR